MSDILIDQRGRSLKRISLQKRAELRKRYVAEIPRWRHPLGGYLVSIPIVGLGLLITLLGQHLLPHFYFPGTPLLISILLIALIWGVGPSLFSVLLGSLALDYFFITPTFHLEVFSWDGISQLLPLITGGLIIAIITAQRESARYRALYAEQIANEHADELAIANQELEQANQLKDLFLSMASHELKTPITSIRGQAQIILRRISKQRDMLHDMETIRTALEKIDEQTHRLNSLVDDLLDLSSIRAGKIGLRLRPCNPGDVCRDVVEDQRLLSGRDIELQLPTKPITLQADSDRLGQVVTNLVSNAVKYSPEGTPIQVRLSQQDGTAIIEVQDAGACIPKEQQLHIYEPFYRAPGTQASSKGGWGLGLAICKDIVERHGGRIWCASEQGNGTTFGVELPLR